MQHDDGIATFGASATDQITGYDGIVLNVAYHVSGCERIGVRALDVPDEADETQWFYPTHLDLGDDPMDGYFEEPPVTSTPFDLGWHLRDRITGAEGIATTITCHLHNCPRAALTPLPGEEPPEESQDRFWFDAPRLEVVNRPDEGGLVNTLSEWVDTLQGSGEAATGAAGDDYASKTNDGGNR